MTESAITTPDAVHVAEQAWLDAMITGQDAMRGLMHPDCRVVHSAVGRIDGVEDFLQHTARMGRITRNEAHDVAVRCIDKIAIVACLQELHIAYMPDLTPFVIQAAVTRVWVPEGSDWKLTHMQLSRRQAPG